MTVLRSDLLTGKTIAVAGGDTDSLGDALVRAGARVEELEAGLDEPAAEEWARRQLPLRALVFDARPAFAGGGEESLRLALERAWAAIRALAVGALIPAQEPTKIVLVGPPPGAGVHAMAARAALENLARTLSVEWARYAITVTAMMPGEHSSEQQLSELLCFLVSAAGDYLSGCRLDLGIVPFDDPR